jgi:heme/copper-type cytochrome/quinol oxidase subunit 2
MQKNGNPESFTWRRQFAFLALTLCCCCGLSLAQSQPRVIEILAVHDSRYKMAGQTQPMIIVKAGEEILLRITAKKAQNHNRDGSIHGFALLRAKDRKPVPGWDLLLKPGTQEFTLAAPPETGDYLVICTVICSPDHEQMNMKFVVEP